METKESEAPSNTNLLSDAEIMSRREFFHRVMIFVGTIAAVVIFLVLLWHSSEVILLIFAGLLVAVFLRAVSERISRHTPLSETWALTILLTLIAGATWLFVRLILSSMENQFDEISRQLPQTIENLRQSLAQYRAGRWILEQIPSLPIELGGQPSNVFGRITGFFSSFLGIVVNIAIVLAAGVFFAFDPKLYYEGVIKLFPSSHQQRVREVFATLNFNLRRWLVGRITVMTLNGILTALGLWFLGVPLALPLGLITALLNFIPNIGPFLAAVPAILVALTQSPTMALYTTGLFLVIQNLEGFVLTPLVQQKAVALPPVLIIAAQLLLGIMFGFLGVLLAVPIVAVVFVLVKMLYIEDLLGNHVEVIGEPEAKKNH